MKDRIFAFGGVVLSDLASGPAFATGLLTWGVATLLALTADVRGFSPGAADPLNFILTTTAFLSPMAAGAGALHAGRLTRSGVAALAETTPRRRQGALLVAVVTVTSAQWFALGCATLVMLARSDLAGGPRPPAAGLLVALALSVVLASVMAGVALGTRWTSVLCPPILALSVFAWIYTWSFASGKYQRLSPIYPDVFYRVWYQPHVALVLGQIGVVVGLTAALCWILVRRPLRIVAAAVASTLLVASSALWAATDADPVEFRNAPQQPPCRTHDEITLCHWPESAGQVEQSLRALRRVHTALAGVWPTPETYYETGLADQATRSFDVPDAASSDYLHRAVQAAVPPRECDTPAALEAEYDLASLFQAVVLGQTSSNRGIRTVQTGGPTEIRTWVHRQVTHLQDCQQ